MKELCLINTISITLLYYRNIYNLFINNSDGSATLSVEQERLGRQKADTVDWAKLEAYGVKLLWIEKQRRDHHLITWRLRQRIARFIIH